MGSTTIAVRAERAARTFAWKALRHSSRRGDEAYLDLIAPPSPGAPSASALLAELRAAPELVSALSTDEARRWARRQGERLGRSPEEDVESLLNLGGTGSARALLLYGALRRRRPTVVIETGCFTGWDSTVILLALARNGAGRLYTLDLPGYSADKPSDSDFQASLPSGGLPHDLGPGFLAPDVLRDRWDLRLGDARELLPALLDELTSPVDVFFHDSEHSYGHMMWEYTTVAPKLARGALLASDDLAFNTAFWDFCTAFHLRRLLHQDNANVGAAIWAADAA